MGAEENIKTLRSETADAQKVRSDLVKWKLLLVAALGSAALGLASEASEPLLLALIPLVCLYTDILCYHHDLRTLVVGRFLRESSDNFWVGYEKLCSQQRAVFSLEDAALFWSTAALSVLVAGLGVAFQVVDLRGHLGSTTGLAFTPSALYASGCFALLASIRLKQRHAEHASSISDETPQMGGLGLSLLGAVPMLAWLPPDKLAALLEASQCRPALPLTVRLLGLVTLVAGLYSWAERCTKS